MASSKKKGNVPAPSDANLPVPLERADERYLAPLDSALPQPGYPEEEEAYAPNLSSPLNLGNLLKAFRQRWLLALFAGLSLCVLFGAVAWYLRPAKYTAYALLQVEESEPPPLLPDSQRWQAAPQERYFENTQVALIKSRPIVLAALRRPEVADLELVRSQNDPATWLESSLNVGFLDKTNILRVSLDGTTPTELAALVNAVKDAYMEEAVNVQRNKKLDLLDNLEKVYLNSEEKIHNQRTMLRELAQTLKSGDPKSLAMKEKALLSQYASLQGELSRLQAELRNAEIELEIHKANERGATSVTVPDYLITQAVEADELVRQKRSQLDQLDNAIRQRSAMLGPGHSILVQLEKDRKALVEGLKELRARLRDDQIKQIQEQMRGKQQEQAQRKQHSVKVYREQEKLLKADVERARKEAEKLGTTSFDLELKRSELEQAEMIVNRLREEKERLQVELQSSKQRITVLHPAEVPTTKNHTAQARVVGFAAFFGLALGIFGICFWEARARRVTNKEDVIQELGCRVIGVLPWVDEDAERRRNQALDSLTVLSASVDDLRALLLCETEEQQTGRILMVTSAVAREGKTTLASHLAMSIAQAGRKTLLMDCDFRRPRLHHVFDISCDPGLSDVLRGKMSAAEAARPGPVAGLSILTTGEDAHQISQAQVMHEMRKLMAELRKTYDFILVDSCPVLAMADILLIGKRVDGVLLSIRPGTSQFPLVSEAFERLTSLRIPILGAVVNGVRSWSKTYGYDYLLESKAYNSADD